ncbi:hypothetical protein [Ruegeria atlantica]|uniref:hypothetical protein n=1 Tax=Ruegeria atlantica TaxID=81569 RepID=UPI00147B6F5B|nr:hypothetical protein [Ruegeria atlantica]
MSKNSHVDGVENIAFAGNAVRLSLFAFKATASKEGNAPAREESASLVLSPEAFLRTRAAFNQLFDDLLKKGVFKERPNGEAEEDKAVETAAEDTVESDSKNATIN